MTLEEKIQQATSLINRRMGASKNPVLCLSFGKDSMVMLDLILRAGVTLPVIYWKREHHFPQKNRFANEMIERYDLSVYDYPPIQVKLVRNGPMIEVVNCFSIGKHTIEVPSGILPPQENKKFLCALHDMYLKPTGSFDFPWDAMFIGHKDCDVDPLRGAVPLLVDEYRHNTDCPIFTFPIRHFTDADIWEYTKRFDVPQDMQRYAESGENSDYNNDYYPACTACVNPENPDTVHCPIVKSSIPNVSSQIVWAKNIRPAYWGPNTESTENG